MSVPEGNASGSDKLSDLPLGGSESRPQVAGVTVEAMGFTGDAARQVTRLGRRPRPIPPKLYRIGELVEYSGMSRQTIHNYTTMGLITETRWTRGGHRLYDESIFERINRIVELKAQRKSMEYIRAYFARMDGK